MVDAESARCFWYAYLILLVVAGLGTVWFRQPASEWSRALPVSHAP